MIDHNNVEKLSLIFSDQLADICYDESYKDITFLEVFLGFTLAYKQAVKCVEHSELLEKEQLNKINEIFDNLVSEQFDVQNSNLFNLLQQIKEQGSE